MWGMDARRTDHRAEDTSHCGKDTRDPRIRQSDSKDPRSADIGKAVMDHLALVERNVIRAMQRWGVIKPQDVVGEQPLARFCRSA